MKDLFKEAKEFIEKAKRLKSEFEILPYSERLKYMDKEFKGASAIYEGEGRGKEPILSVWPSGEEQIRLYNEWRIRLVECMEPDSNLDLSFERLKKGFEDHILEIEKENPYPEKLITDYTQDQMRLYREKVKSRDLQLQWREFGGAWDITKKVINNLGPFLKAKAYYNYISFLENQPDKLTNIIEPIIKKECLISILWKFNKEIREDQNQLIKRFIYPNGPPVNSIDIDKKASNGSNKTVLLAILAAIRPYKKDEFDYNDFVFARFGIKNYDKTKFDHKDKPEFVKTLIECNTILKE